MTAAAAPRAITVSEGLLSGAMLLLAEPLADLRLEGLAPPADARLIFGKFVQGELTEEPLVDAVLAR